MRKYLIVLIALVAVIIACSKMELVVPDAQNKKGKPVVVVPPPIPSYVTIPIVFHVIWKDSSQNISDAQINSQVDQLNKDFSASNADTTIIIPKAFRALIGNTGIQFKLANRDPNGNVTTGIIRKKTTVASFSSDGNVCFDSLGGANIWDRNSYLNVWVCNKTGAGGVSQYPWGGQPRVDGVIIHFTFVGTVGYHPNNWTYLLGRTLAHEIGHWFGLVHPWGDFICGDDYVSDTPKQEKASGSCPTYPQMSSCSPDSLGDLFYTYMDYTNDNCRVMFTKGQCIRIKTYLNQAPRNSLLTSKGYIK